MKVLKLRSLGLLTLFALAAVGCSDVSSPTMASIDESPVLTGSTAAGILDPNPLFRAVGPSFELSSLTSAPNGMLHAAADKKKGDKLHAVRRAETLRRDISKTKTIDPVRGGRIRVNRAGMKVVIPAGALPGTDPIDVTILAYAGKYHVYEFLPHGIQFNTPIRVEFDITNVQEFGIQLGHRRTDLEKQQEELARCEKRVEDGKKLGKKCKKLLAEWSDYSEDLAWYQDVVDTEGIVGVYFEGDVHGKDAYLQALELFQVAATDDHLIFHTTHFSGYALGM